MPSNRLLTSESGFKFVLKKTGVACWCRLLRAGLALGLLASVFASSFAGAQTRFYVDSSRITNGTGTAVSPWKLLSDVDYSIIGLALTTNSVTLYLSSRSTWTLNSSYAFRVQTNGTVSRRFSIICDEFYNTNVAGTAVWTAEIDNTHRARLTGGAAFSTPENHLPFFNFSLKGLYVDHSAVSPILFWNGEPCTNIHDIYVTNCVADTPASNVGINFSRCVADCYNLVVSGCVISNTPDEAIYIGEYNFLNDTITGVVVESNLCVNTGLRAEGDIDIKPPCYGAIVRYNRHYRTTHGLGGTECGVVIGADAVQCYGNEFHTADTNQFNDWGHGIYLHADGDGLSGKAINSCVIYNNLIYDNCGDGIHITATTTNPAANINGVKVWNNTVVGNRKNGLALGGSNGRTVTIAEIKNNLIAGNANYDVYISQGVTLLSVDHNLYCRSNGVTFIINDYPKTFAEWQALGRDSNGASGTDPGFMHTLLSDFDLQQSSPARNLGVASGFFTSDFLQRVRPGTTWDAGAVQSFVPPIPPQNLQIK